MWELDHKEGWALKNWCFWTVVLEKTLESPLDCKEIQPVHPKGNQSWIFIGRTDAETEIPILWPPVPRTSSLEKTLMLGMIEDRRRRGQQRMTWLDSITDLMDMSLSKLWILVMDREGWRAMVYRITKSQTWLSNWTKLNWNLCGSFSRPAAQQASLCGICFFHGPALQISTKCQGLIPGFTLDVALALLELSEQEVDDLLPLEHEKFLKHKFLVQEILLALRIDKDPIVHSKAMSSFAHDLESSATSPLDSMKAFLDNTPAVSGVDSHRRVLRKIQQKRISWWCWGTGLVMRRPTSRNLQSSS